MKPYPTGPDLPQKLRHAQNWKVLQAQAFEFLRIPSVMRALWDDVHRVGDFSKPWKKRPGGLPVDAGHFSSYPEIAEAYRRAANNTQKLLAENNSPIGMREMTVLQDWMSMLTKGESYFGSFETAGFVVSENIRSIQGLTVHAVLGVIKKLGRTKSLLEKGKALQGEELKGILPSGPPPNPWDSVVTESHALHAVVSLDPHYLQERIPRINKIGTDEELWRAYNYGLFPSEETVAGRVQGGRFRLMQLDEYARGILQGRVDDRSWTRPKSAKGTTMMADVCTEAALQLHRPTFFAGQWDLGVVAPAGESIAFERDSLREQLKKALPHLVDTILHYPKDNPLVR